MGCCSSTSAHSTCSSKSNGERKGSSCLDRGLCVHKKARRPCPAHAGILHRLPSFPNSIFTNGKSRSSCIFTQQGRKGVNQDAMVVWEDFFSEDVTFCGVFDGHGPHGHLVARKVRDNLPLKLLSSLNSRNSKEKKPALFFNRKPSIDDDNEDLAKDGLGEEKMISVWREAFLKSFKAMDKELRSHSNLDCFCSGSTAVTIVKQGLNLFMGNIGDSRAIMGSRENDESMVATQLTVDLKPDLPREAERIKRCKGRVFALQDEPEVPRVWLPFDDAPGLAMARAFGDFCLKDYGVISIPEFTYRKLTTKDQFIVLASDGVWDVLSNEEVVEIVSSAPSRASAARVLVDSASREWMLKYPTSKMDDCAVVCLYLDGKMDNADSDNEEHYLSSATVRSNQSSNAMEPDEAVKLEPSLQRNVTVRLSDEGSFAKVAAEIDGGKEKNDQTTVEDQNWSGLEGVTRVNSLVQLPRFPGQPSNP